MPNNVTEVAPAPPEDALARAEETADRRAFGLDAAQWRAFLAALDAPLQEHDRLERLLREPSVF